MKNCFVSATLILICTLLAACGKESSSASKADTGPRTTAVTEKTARSASSQSSQTPAGTSSDVSSEMSSETSSEAFPEVIEDGENLYFAVTGLDADGDYGYTMHVSMENRSDRDLMITLDNVAIDGVMAPPHWSDTVNAGMKAQEDVVWSDSELSEKCIGDISCIQFDLIAYDEDDPSEGYIVDSAHTLYPQGKEKAHRETYTKAKGDQILFDDDSCSMIVTGKDPDGEWGYTLDVTLVNKGKRDLLFAAEDACVNGTMCDPYWAEHVAAGTISRCRVIWTSEELDRTGIEKVVSITLPVAVYDGTNYEEIRGQKSFQIK